jgi:hypothetical protein
MSGGFETVAELAGPGLGGGIGLWATLKFVRWAFEFGFKRIDLRADRMDAREKALELRYDQRLQHVEKELHQTRQALMLLLNDVAKNNPANPVLQKVAELLGTGDRNLDSPFIQPPPMTPDDGCSALLDKLRVVPGSRKR